jgi:hypothetical protein
MRGAWGLSEQQVTDAISWVISLIEGAIADGRRPHDEL